MINNPWLAQSIHSPPPLHFNGRINFAPSSGKITPLSVLRPSYLHTDRWKFFNFHESRPVNQNVLLGAAGRRYERSCPHYVRQYLITAPIEWPASSASSASLRAFRRGVISNSGRGWVTFHESVERRRRKPKFRHEVVDDAPRFFHLLPSFYFSDPPPLLRRRKFPLKAPRAPSASGSIRSLVNFGCPHLRLIDSNRRAGAKLSNLTHGGADTWPRRWC